MSEPLPPTSAATTPDDEKIAKGIKTWRNLWVGACSLLSVTGFISEAPLAGVGFAGAAILAGLPVRRWMGDAGERVPKWAVAVGSIGFAWVGVTGINNSPGTTASKANSAAAQPAYITNPPSEKQLDLLIDEYAIPSFPPSARDQYPSLFAKLGPRIGEVEGLARKAAYLALRADECDRVALVGPSDTSTRDEIAFYVDCANKTRVRLTEAEIKAGAASNIETAAGRQARIEQQMTEDNGLIRQAKENVSRNLRDPGSAEFGSAVVSRKDGLAVCGIVNARNGFGGMTGDQRFINTESNGIFLEEMRADFGALWARYCG